MRGFLHLLSIFPGFLSICTGVVIAQGGSPGKPPTGQHAFRDPALSLNERISDLLGHLILKEKISLMTHESAAVPRLGIPAYDWWNECLHGIARSAPATIFPQAIGMAATFDTDLVHRVGNAISDEARAIYHAAVARGVRERYMGLTFWSPNINIFRDPRWGRGQETYGEDPYLTGEIGAAFVHGLQGDDPRYLKVAAGAKHYAVHSGPESVRHSFDAVVSRKDLYETYLPAFKRLVDEDVAGVMCAYNRTNHEVCCGSQTLLTGILRDQWLFGGYVVTDCGALYDFYMFHGVSAGPAEAAALGLQSGVNVNCGDVFGHLRESIERGLVDEADVDSALSKQLAIRFRLGMFDPDSLVPYSGIGETVIRSDEHAALALETARKSIVLLKNRDHTLPLGADPSRIYVTGNNAADVDVLLGNYHGAGANLVSILEGIAAHAPPSSIVQYNPGVLLGQTAGEVTSGQTWHATQNDVTIAVVGLSASLEGEGGDAIASDDGGDRRTIELPAGQVKFLKMLREACGTKPLIVVVCSGSAIAMPEVHDLADALLWAWYPGEQGGNAVAEVIFGEAVPSGKLPITVYDSTGQLGDFEDYRIAEGGRTYRYFEGVPLYPFGFGLSYARFTYSDLAPSRTTAGKGDTVGVTVTVTNNGDVPGEEVAQLYLTAQDVPFRTPLYSLKDFQRVRLDPNESKKLHFTLTPDRFTLIDDRGNAVLVPCRYTLTVGGSSPSKRAVDLGAPEPVTTILTVREQ